MQPLSYKKRRVPPSRSRGMLCGKVGGTNTILWIFQIVFIVFGSIWLLAIAKVFLLEKHRLNPSNKKLTTSLISPSGHLKIRSYSEEKNHEVPKYDI